MKSITKRALSGALVLCMATSTCFAADTAGAADSEADTTQAPKAVEMPESGTITKLTFEQLTPTMEAYSPTMLALSESESALKAFDRKRARESMLDAYNGLTSLSFVMGDYGIRMMVSSQQATIQEQLDALEEDTYAKTYEDTILQIQESRNQMAMAAENLYVTTATLEDQLNTTNQKLASLQRTLTATEKMHQLGMVSTVDLENLKTQIGTAQSGAKSLEYQIKTCKQSLQQMIGSKTTGELTLSDVPTVTQEQLSAVQYDTDLEGAMAKSATIISARHNMEDLKDDLDDASYGGYRLQQLQHNYQASVETYNANIATFKAAFQSTYQDLAEKQRLMETEQNELAMEQRNLDVSAYKYKLGMISYNTYLDQKDTYDAAAADVSAAELALYQSYNTYHWATQGIVSTQG